MPMFKQLLVNLITVFVAVFLLAVVAKQLYERNSPYEECVRKDGKGFGVGAYWDAAVRYRKNATELQAWRLTLTEECKKRTHF
jgi:hypothetical protein